MIDLHVHSYVSDGTSSPKEIIKMAYEKKLKAVALTDHDSIEGILDAQSEALKLNVNFIKGIEISTAYKSGRLLHILGLGIDTSNTNFLKIYDRMKMAREEGIGDILEILIKQGVSIDIKDLRKYAVGKYLDRQAIPKYFVKNKICSTVPEVWHRYLDLIPYAKGELLEAEETFEIIKGAGGISVLAHFHKNIGMQGYTNGETENNIKQLVDLGLQGIEKYYPTYSKSDRDYVDYIIDKYKLIPSGGTDFHGSNRPEVTLGEGDNGFFVPDNIYENMTKYFN